MAIQIAELSLRSFSIALAGDKLQQLENTHDDSANGGYSERFDGSLHTEADMIVAIGHAESAAFRVANQRKLIAILAARRQPLNQAKEVLSLLEQTSLVHIAHLERLEELSRIGAPQTEGGRAQRTPGRR